MIDYADYGNETTELAFNDLRIRLQSDNNDLLAIDARLSVTILIDLSVCRILV